MRDNPFREWGVAGDADGREAGFTLVEVITVIIVLGVIAAMALPKFGNLSPEAANANAQSVAGAMGAAAAAYNAKVATIAGSPTGATADCALTLALVSGIDATKYTLGGDVTNGCTVRYTGIGTVTYTTARIAP